MSQRILMVLADKGFPPDIRVEKEALVLSHYHKVYILTQRRFKEPEEEKINGFIILRRLLLHKYMPKPVSYLHMTFQLMYQLIQICIKENIDIIHVHDLPCAGPVILISKILGKPTIIDMHEHFIEMTRPSLGRSIKSRLFLYCLCLLETISCRYSKRIIVVVEENAKRIIQRGVSPNKVIVVSNTPIINDLKKISETFKKNEKIKDHCIISYIGGFSKHRGLDTLIRALPLVIQKSQKIHVLLVGDGELKAILEQMVDEFRLRDYVTFTGWVSFNRAMEYVQLSDVGLIPYHNTPHTNNTIPHKIFQYMYFKKPVIVSNVKPLKRIVEEANCGIVFEAGNHEQLAKKILELINNEELWKSAGNNGQEIVLRKYNWEIDGLKLVRLYASIKN